MISSSHRRLYLCLPPPGIRRERQGGHVAKSSVQIAHADGPPTQKASPSSNDDDDDQHRRGGSGTLRRHHLRRDVAYDASSSFLLQWRHVRRGAAGGGGGGGRGHGNCHGADDGVVPPERRRYDQRSEDERRGRGHGHGQGNGGHPRRHQRHHHQRREQQRRLVVSTVDDGFRTTFHANVCRGTMRYKVHALYCDCPRVVGLRARYRYEAKEEEGKKEEERREATAVADDDDDVGGGGMTSTGRRHGNGDVCDSFDRLNLTTATAIATTTNASNDAITSRASDEEDGTMVDMTIFDNLLVLPDTKANPPYGAYACLGTNRRAFATNRIICERGLAHEIFDANVDDIDGTRQFKVSCARCLLSAHMPNGLVAITSNLHDD
jgi:hypothetical protein